MAENTLSVVPIAYCCLHNRPHYQSFAKCHATFLLLVPFINPLKFDSVPSGVQIRQLFDRLVESS